MFRVCPCLAYSHHESLDEGKEIKDVFSGFLFERVPFEGAKEDFIWQGMRIVSMQTFSKDFTGYTGKNKEVLQVFKGI